MFPFTLSHFVETGTAFSPTDINGLTLWLDASDAATITKNASDQVSGWDDKSSNGIDFSQSGGTALRPIHGASQINSLDVVNFDGSAQFMTHGTALSNIIDAANFTFFAVYEVDSFASGVGFNVYSNPAVIADTGGILGLHLADVSGSGKLQAYNYDGSPDSVQLVHSTATPVLSTIRHVSGILYHGLDGGTESSIVSGDTSTMAGTLRLGSNFNGAKFFNGKLAELLVYDAALGTSDIADVQTYLKDKWGIS